MQLLHVTPVPNPSILWACVSFTRHHLTITGACLFDLKGSQQVELRQLNLQHTLLLIGTEHNFHLCLLKKNCGYNKALTMEVNLKVYSLPFKHKTNTVYALT